MSDLQYTYAVARIRAKEVFLFSAATIDQLLACKTYDNCLQFLAERAGETQIRLRTRKRFWLKKGRKPGR